jgi:hypothetical protein
MQDLITGLIGCLTEHLSKSAVQALIESNVAQFIDSDGRVGIQVSTSVWRVDELVRVYESTRVESGQMSTRVDSSLHESVTAF